MKLLKYFNQTALLIILGTVNSITGISQTEVHAEDFYLSAASSWVTYTQEWTAPTEPTELNVGTDLTWDFTEITSANSMTYPTTSHLKMGLESSICSSIQVITDDPYLIRTIDIEAPANSYIDYIYDYDAEGLVELGRGYQSGCTTFSIPELMMPYSISIGSTFYSFTSFTARTIKTTFTANGSYVSSSYSEPLNDVILMIDTIYPNDFITDTAVVKRWYAFFNGICWPLAASYIGDSFSPRAHKFVEFEYSSVALAVEEEETSSSVAYNFLQDQFILSSKKEPIETVTLYDLNGRIIYQSKANNLTFEINSKSLPRFFLASVRLKGGKEFHFKIPNLR